MGKFGFHSGYVTAQNLQSGSADITVDANGDGTLAVIFPKAMKSAPSVVLSQAEADITGTIVATSITNIGFTAVADGSAVTGDTLTCSWIAHDQSA